MPWAHPLAAVDFVLKLELGVDWGFRTQSGGRSTATSCMCNCPARSGRGELRMPPALPWRSCSPHLLE